MEISQDTKNFIQAIDDYTQGKLRKKNDLTVCFEVGATFGGEQELASMIFNGKVLWKLSQKIKNTPKDAEGIELVQKEFEKALETQRVTIQAINSKLDEKDSKRFQEIYLDMTRGAVLNIIDLSHDFAIVKDMQNK